MKTLNRDHILDQTKLGRETVEVPEWGGSVIVREMTGSERDIYEGDLLIMKPGGDVTLRDNFMKGARAKLAALTLIDEDGERLFTLEDVEALGELSASAMNRVFDVSSRLSGLTADDFEELEKNSSSPQVGDSGSP